MAGHLRGLASTLAPRGSSGGLPLTRAAKLAILALALSSFGIGTTEFVIMGLLPQVALDLDVPLASAGLLISGYALGVTVGGPLLALGMARLSGRSSLVALMTMFIVGNVACALAPGYVSLMVARLATALCHAAFFGIGAVMAAGLAEPDKRTRAMALMFSGLTTANVVGVPLGTFIGQSLGWRATFWAVAGVGLLSWIALLRWLPDQASDPRDLRREVRTLLTMPVATTLAMSVTAATSLFVLFTYVAPIMTAVSGLPEHRIGWALLACGVGLTAGNLLGARLADWKALPSLIGVLVVLTAILLAFARVGATPASGMAVLTLWGAVGFAALSILQGHIVHQARAAPNLASVLNISAFNLGNALGAALGAFALSQGLDLDGLPFLAAVASFGTLVLCAAAWSGSRRGAHRSLAARRS